MRTDRCIVRHNLLDRRYFEDLMADSRMLSDLSVSGGRIVDDFDALLQDLYFLLYKKALVLEPPLLPTAASLIIEALSWNHGLQKLRGRTAGNLTESRIALWLFTGDLLERLRGSQWLKEAGSVLRQLHDTAAAPPVPGPGTEIPTPPDAEQDYWQGILSPPATEALRKLLDIGPEGGPVAMAEEIGLLEALADQVEGKDPDASAPLDPQRLAAAAKQAAEAPDAAEAFLLAAADSDSPGSGDSSEGKPPETAPSSAAAPPDTGAAWDDASSPGLARSLRHKAESGRQRHQELTRGTFHGRPENFLLPDASSQQEERRILTEGRPDPSAAPAAVQVSPDRSATLHQAGKALDRSMPAPLPGAHVPSAAYDAPRELLLKKARRLLEPLNASAASERASKALDTFDEALRHAGTTARDLDRLSFDETLQVYKRTLDPMMVRFFNKVGQKREIARRAQHLKKARRDLPVERIHLDDDLDSVLDDELTDLALGIDAFENSFIDRFLHKNLLTRAQVTRTARHKGPIVLCYDGSGSMEGDKILETKAHVLAFMEVARLQKRRMITIQFASASEPLFVREIHPRQVRISDIFEILDTFLKGGTDFEKPLQKALEILETDRFRHGDILFVTDGICDIPALFKERFLKSKAEKRFRLYAVIIHGITYSDYGDLAEIADEILEIRQRDLSDWNRKESERIFSL